ncbi:hypothetical protein O181_073090 [Austropuccinia psidii MF-1]|uniref:Mitochondrial glyco protein n=1 Tax=Austropuccinia psidii MF-1 TaxID=1389203 RepID=A0A9Q3F9V9_9BASI|nr:hypothetical protein [Austropuccinia psidii MF-1]
MLSKAIAGLSRQASRRPLQLASRLPQKPALSAICLRSSAFCHQTSAWVSPQRPFSASSMKSSAGQTDAELISKLDAELSYEQESGSTSEPQWLTAFKADDTFKILDQPGSDQVILTRSFGNENIRITFSCSDLERDEELDDELELENEDGEKGQIGNCRIRSAITITKPGKGGIIIDSTTDGTAFDIDNVSLYDDEKLALDETSENDWKRRGLYFGPTFVDLDEGLQQSFTEFLNERAIGPELAVIVLDLAEHKEQKEYVRWLKQMSKFVKS